MKPHTSEFMRRYELEMALNDIGRVINTARKLNMGTVVDRALMIERRLKAELLQPLPAKPKGKRRAIYPA